MSNETIDSSNLYDKLMENEEYNELIQVIPDEWSIVTESSEIECYLPKQNKISVVLGTNDKKSYNSENFQVLDLSDAIEDKKGYVFNTGGSIWGLDFVPQSINSTQYLAIGGYNSTTEHHYLIEDFDNNNKRNTIQIWSLPDNGFPHLRMGILHDFGVVVDLKWCPLNLYSQNERLGVLAVLLNDGKICVYVIPHPELFDSVSTGETLFLKSIEPRVVFNLPRTKNICFSWGGNGLLASGTTLGNIIVWNVFESILKRKPVINVNIYNASLTPVRSISWNSLFDLNTLIAADLDGCVSLHDLREPFIPHKIFRVRNLYTCLSGLGYSGGFIYSEADGVVRKNEGYLGRKAITLTSHSAQVWSIANSPRHNFMGSVCSSGYAKTKLFADNKVYFRSRHKTLEHTLYSLVFDESTNMFQYIDGIKPTTNVPERQYHAVLTNPIVGLHRVVWNSNKNSIGWIATGGAAGLCRLEFIPL